MRPSKSKTMSFTRRPVAGRSGAGSVAQPPARAIVSPGILGAASGGIARRRPVRRRAGMLTRIDHVMICVPDLRQGIETYSKLGFNVYSGGVHPGRGTHNAISFNED